MRLSSCRTSTRILPAPCAYIIGVFPVEIACLDLEGVLVPEIWIEFANRTGIETNIATFYDITI